MNITIKVNGPEFARAMRDRRCATALERRAKYRFAVLGVDGDSLKHLLPNGGAGTIVDGNNVPVGKVSVSWRDGYQVSGGWIGRVS